LELQCIARGWARDAGPELVRTKMRLKAEGVAQRAAAARAEAHFAYTVAARYAVVLSVEVNPEELLVTGTGASALPLAACSADLVELDPLRLVRRWFRGAPAHDGDAGPPSPPRSPPARAAAQRDKSRTPARLVENPAAQAKARGRGAQALLAELAGWERLELGVACAEGEGVQDAADDAVAAGQYLEARGLEANALRRGGPKCHLKKLAKRWGHWTVREARGEEAPERVFWRHGSHGNPWCARRADLRAAHEAEFAADLEAAKPPPLPVL